MLEISKLSNLERVEPDFPTEAPSTERGRFPIIFKKPDVILLNWNADVAKTVEIKVLGSTKLAITRAR